jgi:CobQ-like glutamine amidotransferase family enzyme
MNIYGDTGNIIALKHRGLRREIDVKIIPITYGSEYPTNGIDIFFFGGGQDNQQIFVSKDIQKFKQAICNDIESGAVALAICGGYQLFGRFYRPFQGNDLPGLGIFPLETHASNTRMINNLIIKTDDIVASEIAGIYSHANNVPTTLVGFENHSGQTRLDEGAESLGSVLYGYGNNESRAYEGCRYKSAFGTYMHGSFLPKNPHFTDYLLALALEYRYKEKTSFNHIPDEFALKAHNFIVSTYR